MFIFFMFLLWFLKSVRLMRLYKENIPNFLRARNKLKVTKSYAWVIFLKLYAINYCVRVIFGIY